MKKNHIWLFLIGLASIFPSVSILAQCCPYIDSVTIIPENPTSDDTVFLATTVITPGQGAYLGYTLSDESGDPVVEACYYSGPLTALQTYVDTISLGVFSGGNYQINFLAYISENAETCIETDTNGTNLPFQVSATLNITHLEPSISLYPNPVADVLNISTTNSILKAELHDLTGKLLRSVTAAEARKQQLDMNQLNEGIYFIRFYFADGTEEVRKILKQR